MAKSRCQPAGAWKAHQRLPPRLGRCHCADAQANAQRQILLDDGTHPEPGTRRPTSARDNTLRAGDTLDSLTGVIDYGLATSDNTGCGQLQIHPTTAVNFTRVNQRTAAPLPVGGNARGQRQPAELLHHLWRRQDGQRPERPGLAPSGTTSDCRGADSSAESPARAPS